MSHQVIAFHYKLTDVDGKVLEQSEAGEPFAFMTGTGQIIPGLESVLVTMKTGDKRRVEVEPKDAYGERDLGNIMNVKKNQLPEGDVKVGDLFHGPNGEVVTVTAVNLDSVTLDANHPRAGQKLVFDVEIDTIRAATNEEIAHGHAHGADGHHHH
jgi:FKBP-type peptidyl-prolyl cis-trans isomerase SlyD